MFVILLVTFGDEGDTVDYHTFGPFEKHVDAEVFISSQSWDEQDNHWFTTIAPLTSPSEVVNVKT
jgi:hypothetical protein